MDLFDEIPNYISVYENGYHTSTITIPQMAKDYTEFLRVVETHNLDSANIQYLDPSEDWKDLKTAETTQKQSLL